MIRARVDAYRQAFHSIPNTLCYSVKANSTFGILRLLANAGAGFDVVSGGELERVLRVSRKAVSKVVFSGVGKTAAEMELALRSGILLFNLESASELNLLSATASRLKKRAAIAVRVNPDVSAKTHPYISTGLHRHKFGVPIPEARALYAQAAKQPYLSVAGVSVHIGSQITDVGSFQEAIARVVDFVRVLRKDGHDIRYIDAGGGLGISYGDNDEADADANANTDADNANVKESLIKSQLSPVYPRVPCGLSLSRVLNQSFPNANADDDNDDGAQVDFAKQIAAYAKAVLAPLRGMNLHLLLEPGRSIVGPAGVLLTRVLYRKTNYRKRFLIVDAAMNDLLRPSLYGAYHEIVPVRRTSRATGPTKLESTKSGSIESELTETEITDVVGPICETGDFFARDRKLPLVAEGDLLAILDVGAYGAVLSSNYNTRPRAAEVLVDGAKAKVIRRRETVEDQMRPEIQ
jgi:diaminopimelate decarboxylase